MQVLIAISGFCPRIGNVPCTTPFDFLFVISIHVPTWGTTLSISTNLFALIFQSTFPRGERQSSCYYSCYARWFQSTFPRGERRSQGKWSMTIWRFQSTFPRGERQHVPQLFHQPVIISIHVPSWGTTSDDGKFKGLYYISIHVPSWGTTDILVWCLAHLRHFNPRSLVGND